MDAVQIIAKTLEVETGYTGYHPESELTAAGLGGERDPEPSSESLKLAQAVLFALGKHGIRLIEPDDVLEREDDKDAGTVKVLLKADE